MMRTAIAIVAIVGVIGNVYGATYGCMDTQLPAITHRVRVRAATISTENNGENFEVVLLRSREGVACSGAGNLLHGIRLLVLTSGRELYRYNPGTKTRDLWTGEPFYLRQVTDDGTPDMLFTSGYSGAADFENHLHAIRLKTDGARTRRMQEKSTQAPRDAMPPRCCMRMANAILQSARRLKSAASGLGVPESTTTTFRFRFSRQLGA
jgi:hypothetical protein